MNWNQLLNPPATVKRVSLLAGYLAGEVCSLYSSFIAQVMNPVSFRMVANNLKLHAIYGRYEEIYNWDGLWTILLASAVVFAVAWCTVRVVAEAIRIPASRAAVDPEVAT